MKSILITGGAGYFGQAFVRHALEHDLELDRICIYSRGEHRQAKMREDFGNDERLRFFIGDVRDRDRLRRAMYGVDAVVHAAALKRIEVGHYNPIEMFNTNVIGAINVIEAARDNNVDRVVALSTDKAFEPISPYGYSKAMAEALFLAANDNHPTSFAVTRYGNVAGSDGSVIPKWREMMEQNKIPTITDPECTRFWMTKVEAVELVWTTLYGHAKRGLITPILPAYKVSDLAMAVCPYFTNNHFITTGLPHWEKMHESMGPGNCSKDARRMSIEELRFALESV